MLCLYFSFTLLNFVLFRHDCGMFVLKNADCLGQDLDPAAGHYAQKDMPNVRRMVLLELIRLKITSGTSAATLPASIDPKGDGDTKVGKEKKESDSQPSTIENGAPSSDDDSEPSSKRLKPNGAPSIDAKVEIAALVNSDRESHSESDSDPDDDQPLSNRRIVITKEQDAKEQDANTDEDTEDEGDDNTDDNTDDDEDAGEADTVWDMENEGKTDGLVLKLEWLDSILKIENIEPITLGDLLSLLYKPTRDAISCMVDICRRDWVLPQNSFFVADGEDITSESIKLFEGNAVSNAVYIGE